MDFVPYEGVDSTLVGEPIGQVAYAELAPPESWYGEVTSPQRNNHGLRGLRANQTSDTGQRAGGRYLPEALPGDVSAYSWS